MNRLCIPLLGIAFLLAAMPASAQQITIDSRPVSNYGFNWRPDTHKADCDPNDGGKASTMLSWLSQQARRLDHAANARLWQPVPLPVHDGMRSSYVRTTDSYVIAIDEGQLPALVPLIRCERISVGSHADYARFNLYTNPTSHSPKTDFFVSPVVGVYLVQPDDRG
jgi:hypothetical protein